MHACWVAKESVLISIVADREGQLAGDAGIGVLGDGQICDDGWIGCVIGKKGSA